jgi:invasion protein IalB
MTPLRRTFWLFASAALLAGVLTTPTAAQPAQPAAPAQPGAQQPQQTTATYDDWIIRCEVFQGPPMRKSCEMVQYTQAKGGQGGVISQVAVGRAAKSEPLRLVVQLPIGIWLPSGVKLVADAKDPGLVAAFKRCLPQACFADVDISSEQLRRYRTTTEQGQILFKDGNQKDAALPVSFKGFGTAFDALAKE